METSPVSCWHHQPCPTSDNKALLPLPVTHAFLFQSSLSGHPFLSSNPGSRSLPGLSCCGFTEFGEHLHYFGIHGNNTLKGTNISFNQRRFNFMICRDKTFSTQIHTGFKRWAISRQQLIVMIDQCYCWKKLYPFNFENYLHSIYTDSCILLKENKKQLNNRYFHLCGY